MSTTEMINSLFSGAAGAVLAGVLVFFMTSYKNFRAKEREVGLREEILRVRGEILDSSRESIREVESLLQQVRNNKAETHKAREEALKDADRINTVKEQAEEIVEKLEVKTGIKPSDVAAILKPQLGEELQALIPQFQMGEQRLNKKLVGRGKEKVEQEEFIKFSPAFHKKPNVYVSLKRIDLQGQIHRIEVKVKDPTESGFTLVFATWLDSTVHIGTRAVWFAYTDSSTSRLG